MSRTNRSPPVLRAAMMTAPLLLALGGCAVVPIAELAASGAGNQGMTQMAGAIEKFVPGLGNGQTGSCAPGTVGAASGCGPAAQQPVVATKTPVAAATDGQTSACGAPNVPGTSVAGCDAGGMGTMVHGLAGSLEKLVPGSLFSH